MGGVTPNWSIRYPTQDELVTLSHFADMASDVDDALATLDSLRQETLQRPSASIRAAIPSTQNVAPNTFAVVTFAAVDWDTDIMWNAGTPDRLTIKTAGFYELVGKIDTTQTVATTLTAQQIEIVTSGASAVTYARKYNRETQTGSAAMNVIGIWQMAVNDIVQLRFWWNGTGTMQPGGAKLGARMLCPL